MWFVPSYIEFSFFGWRCCVTSLRLAELGKRFAHTMPARVKKTCLSTTDLAIAAGNLAARAYV